MITAADMQEAPITREEFDNLRIRLESVEAFILRRPPEPIPQPILDAALAAQTPPAEPAPELEPTLPESEPYPEEEPE